MRRFILLLLVVVVAGAAGSPFVYGLLFKQQMMSLVDALNKAGIVQLSVIDYKRGWTTSHAQIKVEPGTAFQDNPAIQSMISGGNASLVVDIQIQHGPLIHNPIEKRYALAYGSVSGFMSLPEQIEQALYGKKQPDGFLQFNVVSSFGGNWFSQYTIPPITPPPVMPGLTAHWDGLNADFYAEVNQHKLDKYLTNINFKILNVTAKKEVMPGVLPNVAIQPVTYENSMDNANGHVFESVLNAPSIVITSPDPVFVLKNFKQIYTQKYNDSDNVLNIYSSQTLDDLNLGKFLPVELSKSGIYLNIKNLNAKEFNDVYDYTVSIRRKMTDEETSKLQSMIPKIISPSSYMTVDLGFTTSEGPLILNSKLTWPQLLSGEMNMQTLLMSANATVAFRISIPLLDKIIQTYLSRQSPVSATPLAGPGQNQIQAGQQPVQMPQTDEAQAALDMIQHYLQAGYLEKDNNDYVSSITYQDGTFKANGHEVSN